MHQEDTIKKSVKEILERNKALKNNDLIFHKHPGKEAILHGLFGQKTTGKEADNPYELIDESSKAFLELPEAERAALLLDLFPHYGGHLIRAINGMNTLPLQRYLNFSAAPPFRLGIQGAALITEEENQKQKNSKFGSLLRTLLPYRDQSLLWITEHLAYLNIHYFYQFHGAAWYLLASVMDEKTDLSKQVFDLLVSSIRGTHEIAQPHFLAYAALLATENPNAWAEVEYMLRSAKREEGLRELILGLVDISHPEIFPRILSLLIDEEMLRFSSVVQAVNLWFFQRWDSQATKPVKECLETVLLYLKNKEEAYLALESGTPEQVFFALYALAFRDVGEAIEAAKPILLHPNDEHRFAAVLILYCTGLKYAHELLFPLVDDPNLGIAYQVIWSLGQTREFDLQLSQRLKLSFHRWPKKMEVNGLLFQWVTLSCSRKDVAKYTVCEKEEDLLPVIPYVEEMHSSDRKLWLQSWAQRKKIPLHFREFLLHFSGDSNEDIAEEIYVEFSKIKPSLTEPEFLIIEGHLKRTATKLRGKILPFLINQKDATALASAKRLINSANLLQRTAGLEILRQLVDKDRVAVECRAIAAEFQKNQAKLSSEETLHLQAILGDTETRFGGVPLAEQWCFGLAEEKDLTPIECPPTPDFQFFTPASDLCIQTLLELVEKHKDVPIKNPSQDEEVPFGSDEFYLYLPNGTVSLEQARMEFPLSDVWEEWYENRSADMRDADGLELARAHLCAETFIHSRKLKKGIAGQFIDQKKDSIKGSYLLKVRRILDYIFFIHHPDNEYVLSAKAAQYDISQATSQTLSSEKSNYYSIDRSMRGLNHFVEEYQFSNHPFAKLNKDAKVSVYKSMLYFFSLIDKMKDAPSTRFPISVLLNSWLNGIATDADLFHFIFKTKKMQDEEILENPYSLQTVTSRRIKDFPQETEEKIRSIGNRIVDRFLEIELVRGESPTRCTHLIESIQSMEGSDRLLKVLQAMRNLKLRRDSSSYYREVETREEVFSHLISISYPSAHDLANPDETAAKFSNLGLKEQRVIEIAMLSPQWASCMEKVLGWPQFTNAIWWFHAHTKSSDWQLSQEVRNYQNSEISLRTPLTQEELTDGAVDVNWFYECSNSLGEKRIEELYQAAKFACTNIGHARARIYCDALRSALQPGELISQIREKRNQDKVRALGLIPLPKDREAAEEDLLTRYQALEEFQRGSKQFGAQRRTSETRATEIAMDNLARTAGYPDPLRLRWAMEIKSLADLRGGSKTITRDDVIITLQIDELGDTEITVTKAGKVQKSIPVALKKDPEVTELGERRAELRKQISRVRRSLEESMIRGDLFLGRELKALADHPLLAPLMSSLVFLSSEGNLGWLCEGGATLRYTSASTIEIDPEDQLRIAHPCDLFASGEWAAWQRDCFVREIVQPFKQVFRELYLPTEREKEEGRKDTTRYAGHQLQPRQALALLGSRNWIHDYEDGGVRRTWYKENLMAWITFEGYFSSPAEVEGLTLNRVSFTKRGEWAAKLLSEIPPRVFSETMRDVDLIVSVAHRTGADPETSESSIEARGALVRETAAVLKLDNVQLEKRYVTIKGQLAQYTVHLGSAEAAVLPGGHISIVAVQGTQRGRLFLPFVDNDPKCAELLSKVLLLARDKEIKDPAIRQQITYLTSN
jgi:hypothetical protein